MSVLGTQEELHLDAGRKYKYDLSPFCGNLLDKIVEHWYQPAVVPIRLRFINAALSYNYTQEQHVAKN